MRLTTRELYTSMGVLSYKPITEQDRAKAAKQAASDLSVALVKSGKMQEYDIVSVGTGMTTAGGPTVMVWSRMDPTVLRRQFPETLDGIPLMIRTMAKDYAHGVAGRTEMVLPRHQLLSEQQHTGVMLCLPIPSEIAAQVAIDDEGAEEVSDLHVTLFFLGDIAEVDVPVEQIELAMERVAASAAPIVGKLGGIGRFAGGPDGDPVYLSVDAPRLNAFREKLGEAITKIGVTWREDHGYTPHMTLAYIPQRADLPKQRVDAVPVVFRNVGLWMGGDHHDVPLTGVAEGRLARGSRLLREFMFGSTWMGSGHSYPGPEPGKMFSLGVVYPGQPERVDGTPKKPEKPGREREGKNRWQRKRKR